MTNDYVGIDYNVPDEETRKYVYLLARSEGILLDPCYTGKGFRGYIDMIEKGIIDNSKGVIFLHTGGTPALFTEEHAVDMQKELWNGDKIHVV